MKDGGANVTTRYGGRDEAALFDAAGRQPIDQAAIIESQQRTIARLLDEEEHLCVAIARLKDIENSS